MSSRRRLDADLVRRKLVPSREHARNAIRDRRVTVNGAIAQKAAHLVSGGDAVELLGPPPRYVGRGGLKLEGALASFGIDPTGARCVDVGSSTGGFTDCLLQSGAETVLAVDVGRAQLHERLRNHPRVTVREQHDVRSLKFDAVGAPFDLVVVDVSFIGLDNILDSLVSLAGELGRIIALVKPQFEAGRAEADKGRGVITDPAVWKRTLGEAVSAARRRGLAVGGVAVSPITGGAGNVEFFLLLGGAGAGVDDDITSPAIDGAVEQARAPDEQAGSIGRAG